MVVEQEEIFIADARRMLAKAQASPSDAPSEGRRIAEAVCGALCL